MIIMPDPLKTKHAGNYPEYLSIGEITPKTADEGEQRESIIYAKCHDLRYGTNPSQTAALYNAGSFLGTLKELKTGKQGPSQTNMEDIFFAALTVGYFGKPTIEIMKHENPSGFATQYNKEPLWLTYKKARDADFRAAFGGTVFINRNINKETAEVIKEQFTEVLVAPEYDEGVVAAFKGTIRIFKYDEKSFNDIPRFIGDKFKPEIKRLSDGSVIISDPLLISIKTAEDLKTYVVSERKPSENELKDLLTGYRIRLRSNSIRMIKNGYTTALGTGQQDRIMCIDIAAYKNRKLAELAEREHIERAADYAIPGSCLVSDGFFPFTDSIDFAHNLGITAVLAPHGGEHFNDVLAKTDEYGMAFVDLPGEMRFFDHH